MIASHRFMMEYNCTLDKEDKYYVWFKILFI
jgi:hypothetical protein